MLSYRYVSRLGKRPMVWTSCCTRRAPTTSANLRIVRELSFGGEFGCNLEPPPDQLRVIEAEASVLSEAEGKY
jgi:hypothetical protein